MTGLHYLPPYKNGICPTQIYKNNYTSDLEKTYITHIMIINYKISLHTGYGGEKKRKPKLCEKLTQKYTTTNNNGDSARLEEQSGLSQARQHPLGQLGCLPETRK